jgi:hypothetical protein
LTDTEGGHGFALRQIETGAERDFAILLARGPSNATSSDVQRVLEKYLDDPNPPPRVTLDRQGNEISPSG